MKWFNWRRRLAIYTLKFGGKVILISKKREEEEERGEGKKRRSEVLLVPSRGERDGAVDLIVYFIGKYLSGPRICNYEILYVF